jgi:hypothetical protein
MYCPTFSLTCSNPYDSFFCHYYHWYNIVFECVVHCRYLPVRVDPATGRMTYSHSIRLTGVPARKISDSSFWFLLFRPLVYRSQKQDGPTFLYVNIRRAVFGVLGR